MTERSESVQKVRICWQNYCGQVHLWITHVMERCMWKSKVRIVDGEVSKVFATEQKLLSREELEQGIRLGMYDMCFRYIQLNCCKKNGSISP